MPTEAAPIQTKRRSRLPRIGRDTVILTCGLAGLAHETLIAKVERPTLLFAFMAMIGLPAFFNSDERRNRNQ